jgi:hypothetical protein
LAAIASSKIMTKRFERANKTGLRIVLDRLFGADGQVAEQDLRARRTQCLSEWVGSRSVEPDKKMQPYRAFVVVRRRPAIASRCTTSSGANAAKARDRSVER